MNKPETMMIDDVKYVREDSVNAPVEIGEKTYYRRRLWMGICR